MSDFRAVGGVSATLRTLLQDRMEFPDEDVRTRFLVTVSTPRSGSEEGAAADAPRINLFLYRVSESPFLRNQQIPGRGYAGEFGTPPLSLNLHYLVTAYGASRSDENEEFVDETLAQYLLGSAMRALYDHAVVTEELVTLRAPAGRVILDPSLRGEFERVKVTMDPISLEDATKIWTALTLPYRTSASYQVNVVQIESGRSRRFAPPVRELPDAGPRVYAVPFQRPEIRDITVRRLGMAADEESRSVTARVGDTLILKGSNLGGPDLRLLVGTADLTSGIALREPSRLEATLPDDPELTAGPQPVEVVVDLLMGDPPEPHSGFRSNQAVFMLVPRVTSIDPVSGPAGTDVTLEGTRLFEEGRDCRVLVGDLPFSLENPEGQPPVQTPTEVHFTASGLDAGTYRVRVRVNGGESLDDITLQIT